MIDDAWVEGVRKWDAARRKPKEGGSKGEGGAARGRTEMRASKL